MAWRRWLEWWRWWWRPSLSCKIGDAVSNATSPASEQPAFVLLPTPRRVIRRGGFFSGRELSSHIDPRIHDEQGYALFISPEEAVLRAHDAAGEFYGRQTFAQLRRQFPDRMPCLDIHDWPDFPVRGVMLDISRDKVPTMATLRELIDMLAGWKINQIQLYTEHTFAYRDHETVWKDASPMTAEEIVELDRFCRERFIDLVP